MLNGVVFVLIGLQLPSILASIKTYGLADLVSRAAVMSGLLVALRIVWVYPGTYVSYFIRHKRLAQTEPWPSPRAIFVVGWTGMDGPARGGRAGRSDFVA